jgi:hypothetical protein
MVEESDPAHRINSFFFSYISTQPPWWCHMLLGEASQQPIAFVAQPINYSPLGFEAQTKKLLWWVWGSNHQTIAAGFEAQTKKPKATGFEAKLGEMVDIGFEATSCRPHTASPDLSIIQPTSTQPVLDHPRSSAPGLLLLPWSSSLSTMPHLSPAHHKTIKHVSPHKIDSSVEPLKFLRLKFKPRQVSYSSQIKPRYWPHGFLRSMPTRVTKRLYLNLDNFFGSIYARNSFPNNACLSYSHVQMVHSKCFNKSMIMHMRLIFQASMVWAQPSTLLISLRSPELNSRGWPLFKNGRMMRTSQTMCKTMDQLSQVKQQIHQSKDPLHEVVQINYNKRWTLSLLKLITMQMRILYYLNFLHMYC